MPDHVTNTYKMKVPDHLRSWTDAARVCASLADRVLNAENATPTGSNRGGGGAGRSGKQKTGGTGRVQAVSSARRGAATVSPQPRQSTRDGLLQQGIISTAEGGEAASPPHHTPKRRKRHAKKHALPKSALAGMLKFFGAPTTTMSNVRRGMKYALGVAQCVACLVRHGVSLPVTCRVTQKWGPGGGCQGSVYDEIAVDEQLPGNASPGAASVGRVDDDRSALLPILELGPSTTSEERRTFESGVRKEQPRLNKKRERERDLDRDPPPRSGDGTPAKSGGKPGGDRNRDRSTGGGTPSQTFVVGGSEREAGSRKKKERKKRVGDGGVVRGGGEHAEISRAVNDQSRGGGRSGAGAGAGRRADAGSSGHAVSDQTQGSGRSGASIGASGRAVASSSGHPVSDQTRGNGRSGAGARAGEKASAISSGHSRGFDGKKEQATRRHASEPGLPRGPMERNRWDRNQQPAVNERTDDVRAGTGGGARDGAMENGRNNGGKQGQAGGGTGRGEGVPSWRQNVPISSLSEDYLDYYVRERERNFYKSAGIIPYR